jgi:glycosyltransferase involved in cell wall biosynthesis
MKILHVTPSFGLGGMEKIITSFINRTREHLHVLMPLDGSKDANRWIKNSDVDHIEFDKSKSRLMFFANLYRMIKAVRPDLIMSYNWGGIDALWVGRMAKVKFTIHCEHGFNIDEVRCTRKRRDLLRICLYHLASHVIVVSSYLEYIMKAKYFLKADYISFIPNGINTDHFCPDFVDRERVRQQLGFTDGDTVAAFCGRLDPVKNFEFMLEILGYCSKIDGNIKLMIIGDGPERTRIREMAAGRKIGDKLRLVGQKDDVLPYLRAADVFVLTSFREQMPVSVLEAMAVGLPILAPRTGELPGLIASGEEGLLRELDDGPEEFGKSLLALVDSRQRRRIGDAARSKVVSVFGEEAMIQKYRAVIEGLRGRASDARCMPHMWGAAGGGRG